MKKCLIYGTGWIGDCLFSTPLFKMLKEEQGFDIVDFISTTLQPLHILKADTFLDNLFYIQSNIPNHKEYNTIYRLRPNIDDKSIAPTIQFQEDCRLNNKQSEFYLDIPPYFKELADQKLSSLSNKKIICYQGDWISRRWKITLKEKSNRKFNTDNIFPTITSNNPGNVELIINTLKERMKDYIFIPIIPNTSPPYDLRGFSVDPNNYALNAAIIKKANMFIGAEGGLSNLSSGLGVKTIITTCHMHLMFGEQGVISKCSNICLGPEKLFPGKGHINIDPFALDEDVIDIIYNNK